MNRGAWWATVQRVAKGQTRLKQLSIHPRMLYNHDCSGKCPEKLMRGQACSNHLKCLTQPPHYCPKRTKRLSYQVKKDFSMFTLFFFLF